MIWSLMPSCLKTAIISVFAGGVIAAFSFSFGFYRGDQIGFNRAEVARLKADMNSERERAQDDAKLQGLSDYDFCIVALHRRGMPADQCDELRRLPGE